MDDHEEDGPEPPRLADLWELLLMHTEYVAFVVRVLTAEPGRWQKVLDLLDEVGVDGPGPGGAFPALVEAERAEPGPTWVSWLPLPDEACGPGWAGVSFLNGGGPGAAYIYNRRLILDRYAHLPTP